MQQRQNSISQKIISMLIGTAWVAGLLIAGSDSPYMPWTNTIGLILFLGASILLSKRFRTIGTTTGKNKISTIQGRTESQMLRVLKKNQRIKMRYVAMG